MEPLAAYIPIDRRHALFQSTNIPDYTRGTALFADISGFTPLTEAMVRDLGAKRGAEELTRQLNMVYDALITQVHTYHGSVINFSGDAITCWFDNDTGLRATACALSMQAIMDPFTAIAIPSMDIISLALKIAIATGPVRRFVVGTPNIQYIDVLAGATLERMATAEKHAGKGEIILAPETLQNLNGIAEIATWRYDVQGTLPLAVVSGLKTTVEPNPWSTLDMTAFRAEHARPWILPAIYERIQSGQGHFLAEIRPAVSLFLRFSGIDYDDDPEAGPKLDAYIQWVQQVLATYEGFLLQLTVGDKGSYLYAAFGAPIAHDDDPIRAVAVALALQHPPADLSYISTIQIGISRGQMRSGAYGGSARRTYGVLGDEVNLAARLMSHAEPGQILVSGRIAYNTDHIYAFEPIGLIPLKGKKDPVPVSLVQGRKTTTLQRPDTIFTGPIVGRDHELALFDAMLAQMLGGTGQILRVEGVAGIGKSHLNAAFAKRAMEQQARVVLGACQSISQNIAYVPWRHIFRSLFGLSETTHAEQPATKNGAQDHTTPHQTETARNIAQVETRIATMNRDWLLRLPLLGDLLGLPISDNPTTASFDPRLRQEALFALVIDLVKMWAHQKPLVLLIEDVHWMDEASLGLTLALSRVITHMPVLLTLIQRPALSEHQPILPDLYHFHYHHTLHLNELSQEGVAALIATRRKAHVSPLALAIIHAQAQGNPFFVEELVDTLCESKKLYHNDSGMLVFSEHVINALRDAQCLTKDAFGEWSLDPNAPLSAAELGIPDSVHGIVLSRIDRLPEEHKLTLKVASIIGRIFDLDILAHVHPSKPQAEMLLEQIKTVEARDFTRLEQPYPRLTYIFKHSITQEVAYETLLDSQRRELHYAVGITLERLQPSAIEQLAYHYSRSDAHDKALLYLDKAARKTQHEHANETALTYYTQALALEERWEWRQGVVEILHTLGRREEQETALQALESIADAPPFNISYLWGQYYEALGQYTQAQTAIEHALTICRQQQETLGEARCLTQLGLIKRRIGDYEDARIWYAHALELFQNEITITDDSARTFVETLNGLGYTHLQQTNFDQARTCFEQALQVSCSNTHRKGEADALNNLGVMFSYQRHLSEALTYYRQALELRRAIGDRSGEGASLGSMAQAMQEMGDYDQARAYLYASQSIHQAIGNRWNEINDWNDLGVLYQELGNLDRAQECLQHGLALSQAIGDEAGQAYILANLGLIARDQGALESAETILMEGLSLAQKQDDSYLVSGIYSYLGTVSLQRNNPDAAIEQAHRALTMQQEFGMELETTLNLATLAVAYLSNGNIAGALDYAYQALNILDECGGEGPEFPPRDYFLCYQVLQTAGENELSQKALQSAYNLVMARADKIIDSDLRTSFLERVPINHQIIEAMRLGE